MYGYPSLEAAEVALTVVRDWLLEDQEEGVQGGKEGAGKGLERIIFCCFEEKDERAYTELIPYARLRDVMIVFVNKGSGSTSHQHSRTSLQRQGMNRRKALKNPPSRSIHKLAHSWTPLRKAPTTSHQIPKS